MEAGEVSKTDEPTISSADPNRLESAVGIIYTFSRQHDL